MGTPKPSFKHAVVPFVLIGVLLVAAFAVRGMLVPATYGDLGHYRATSPGEIRARAPIHQGQAGCAECHDEVAEVHQKDAHARVQCEVCHGPGQAHAAEPETVKPVIPAGQEACLVCHQHLDARPGEFPQIDRADHYRFVGVKDAQTACTACHSPHEPLFMDRDLHTARLHPLVHRCRDCHVNRLDETLARPEDHPAIFQCAYCHEEKVRDFATRPHAKIRCTTCHIFFRESDFAGRIIRDADPRFCLLCHRQADFRSDDAAPGIEWPAHLEDVGDGEADAKKRCVDCHRDRIHAPRQAKPTKDQGAAGEEVRHDG